MNQNSNVNSEIKHKEVEQFTFTGVAAGQIIIVYLPSQLKLLL